MTVVFRLRNIDFFIVIAIPKRFYYNTFFCSGGGVDCVLLSPAGVAGNGAAALSLEVFTFSAEADADAE